MVVERVPAPQKYIHHMKILTPLHPQRAPPPPAVEPHCWKWVLNSKSWGLAGPGRFRHIALPVFGHPKVCKIMVQTISKWPRRPLSYWSPETACWGSMHSTRAPATYLCKARGSGGFGEVPIPNDKEPSIGGEWNIFIICVYLYDVCICTCMYTCFVCV